MQTHTSCTGPRSRGEAGLGVRVGEDVVQDPAVWAAGVQGAFKNNRKTDCVRHLRMLCALWLRCQPQPEPLSLPRPGSSLQEPMGPGEGSEPLSRALSCGCTDSQGPTPRLGASHTSTTIWASCPSNRAPGEAADAWAPQRPSLLEGLPGRAPAPGSGVTSSLSSPHSTGATPESPGGISLSDPQAAQVL